MSTALIPKTALRQLWLRCIMYISYMSFKLSFALKLLVGSLVIFLGLAFFTPLLTLAQEPTTQTSLSELAQCTGPDCSTCNIVYMANGLIKWLIGIVFLLFAGLLAIAGVRLVTSGGNPGALQSAKDNFINALIGFVIILSAWLIIDTLMRALVGNPEVDGSDGFVRAEGNIDGWLFWSQVECMERIVPTVTDPDYIELSDINFDGEYVGSSGALPLPPGITGSNCSVNEGALVAIPGQGGHRAMADVASRFVSMQRNLAASGANLSVTSSYRSDARQTQLWDECPRCQREGTVARPCSRGGNGSAHSSGVALDLSSSGDRCNIIRACRSAGASFIMTYARSGHVHCDWRGGGRTERLTISCP